MISLGGGGRALSLRQAAQSRLLLQPVNVSTIHRWRQKGLNGVRLATWRLGGRRITSEEALHEFLTKVNQASEGPAENVSVETPSNRRARDELRRMGVLPPE